MILAGPRQCPDQAGLLGLVAGVDEAGRGCLAGPVVAGAVILPRDYHLPGLTDSKALTAVKREHLAQAIKAQALSWALGFSWPKEIEDLNILQASLLAMARAVTALACVPDHILVDGNQPLPLFITQQSIVGGDILCPCISAASIVAKTFRDALMIGLDKRYPGYGFAKHKGYATQRHQKALRTLGPCVAHRYSFRGVTGSHQERKLCLPNI